MVVRRRQRRYLHDHAHEQAAQRHGQVPDQGRLLLDGHGYRPERQRLKRNQPQRHGPCSQDGDGQPLRQHVADDEERAQRIRRRREAAPQVRAFPAAHGHALRIPRPAERRELQPRHQRGVRGRHSDTAQHDALHAGQLQPQLPRRRHCRGRPPVRHHAAQRRQV